MALPVGSGAADTAVAEILDEFGWLKLDHVLALEASKEDKYSGPTDHVLPFEAISTDG